MNHLGKQVLIRRALTSSMPPSKEKGKYSESGLLTARRFEPFRSKWRRHSQDGHQAEKILRSLAGMVNGGISVPYDRMGRALGIGRTRSEVGETCLIQ